MPTTRSKKRPTDPDLPAHLGDAGRALWARVRRDFTLADAAALHLLTLACEAADTAQQARESIERDGGPTYLDRWKQPRAHPASAVLRDARAQQVQCLRALGLTGSPED